ncbi:MAG: hypothetical protein KGI38_12040 [Thaumarchaeota archaeon]|nr:hypothetical protein [Nitrososphaerota archaeon]
MARKLIAVVQAFKLNAKGAVGVTIPKSLGVPAGTRFVLYKSGRGDLILSSKDAMQREETPTKARGSAAPDGNEQERGSI